MSEINVKGDIVINEYAEFYKWFDWSAPVHRM